MTDQLQKHIDPHDGRLSISLHLSKPDTIVIGTSRPYDEMHEGKRCGAIIEVPAARLLAMIDAADPDAMRAYLRERSDLMDSPDESCSTLEDMLPADLAAEAARFREVPEADSPEDIDERVPPREALLTDAQERRLYLIEQLTKTLPADESPALAHWIITGGMYPIEDLTISGEDLSR